MRELSGKPLGEPEMRDNYLIKDLLPPGRPGRFSLDQQLTGTFGQLFTGHALMSGDDRKRGVRHERATLSL